MKTKLKIEPILLIDFKNQKIAVSTLPEEIRNEIETMTKLMQDNADYVYEVEKCELALQMKKFQINAMLLKLYDQSGPEDVSTSKENVESTNDEAS